MTTPELPPAVARELEDLRRRMFTLERQSGRTPLRLMDLSDVASSQPEDQFVPVWNRASGRFVMQRIGQTKPHRSRLATDTGLTITYTTIVSLTGPVTLQANSLITALVVCDFEITTLGPGAVVGRALLNGETDGTAAEAVMHEEAGRATVAQHYQWTVANPSGPHTIALQARKTSDAGACSALAPHTGLQVWVWT